MNIDINELCNNLSINLSFYNKRETSVIYFSGKKAASYFSPMVVFSTKEALGQKIQLAWFEEIWIDNKCIFREYRIPNDDNWELAGANAKKALIQSIFNHGVVSAKRQIEKNETRHQ